MVWPSPIRHAPAASRPALGDTHFSLKEDPMRGHAVVAAMLVASVHAQALAKEGSVDWAMNATIIDGCSCRMLCPCIFGSPATVGSAATHQHSGHRSCFFNMAVRVNKGR